MSAMTVTSIRILRTSRMFRMSSGRARRSASSDRRRLGSRVRTAARGGRGLVQGAGPLFGIGSRSKAGAAGLLCGTEQRAVATSLEPRVWSAESLSRAPHATGGGRIFRRCSLSDFIANFIRQRRFLNAQHLIACLSGADEGGQGRDGAPPPLRGRSPERSMQLGAESERGRGKQVAPVNSATQ